MNAYRRELLNAERTIDASLRTFKQHARESAGASSRGRARPRWRDRMTAGTFPVTVTYKEI